MSHKSNTRVYKLKNYGNMTLRVESASVAQWCVANEMSGHMLNCLVLLKKKRIRKLYFVAAGGI